MSTAAPDPQRSTDLARTVSLVAQARGGDRSAFDELFARYAPRVRGLVAMRSGHSLDEFVEHDDLVLEAMADAFAKLERFDVESEGGFICWLARLVDARVVDTWRKHHAERRGSGQVRRMADLGASTVRRSTPRAGGPTASQVFASNETQQQLEHHLLALSERYRLVIYLRLVLDLDWSTVAREMSLQDGATARALFHKAAARLRTLLPTHLGPQ